jgi:2-phosphosulfolactate phosphatase
MTTLEVLFTPAEFEALARRDLSETVCVVFDVLRATSSMVVALGNGAEAIRPVETIPEALEAKRQQPNVLLAGERDGVLIRSELTGGVDFDLGNSPREFSRERVAERTIVMTTTNGTRALRACASAEMVLASSFLNLGATANFLAHGGPPNLLLVCSGTFEEAAFEDVLGAGALCEELWADYSSGSVADSARMAHNLFLLEQGNLAAAFARSRNGRRLLSKPELQDDVEFCLRRDSAPLVAELNRQGLVRKRA